MRWYYLTVRVDKKKKVNDNGKDATMQILLQDNYHHKLENKIPEQKKTSLRL